ncbi:MAG: Fe(3+) ABC transporter substrate-binding protein [Prochloraceae cyanobacterium]|nr:Fe(3+) ABC transporter substrate-binding protein [Prochloraceae cyanobacterium]
MKKISRRIFLGAGTATTVVAMSQLLASCNQTQEQTGNKTQQSKEQTEINLYSSRHYNTDNALYDEFTKETGIKVNLVEGKAEELTERIKSEGSNSPADILITVDAGRLWAAKEQGIFAPVDSEILKKRIPANLRDPEGHWFSYSIRARVIMYNKEKIKPEQLSTYEDLANPKWKGKIAIRSSSNIYNKSLVASIIEADGEKASEEWCRAFVANFARPPQGNDRAQIEAAASGIADLAIANTYYLPRYKRSEDKAKQQIFNKIGVFFPNQKNRGTHVNVSGAGLVKTSPNREGAIKFLEYLSSKSAQEYFAQGNDEYPVVKGVSLDPILKSFGTFKQDTVDISSFGRLSATAVKVMDRAGWK